MPVAPDRFAEEAGVRTELSQKRTDHNLEFCLFHYHSSDSHLIFICVPTFACVTSAGLLYSCETEP